MTNHTGTETRSRLFKSQQWGILNNELMFDSTILLKEDSFKTLNFYFIINIMNLIKIKFRLILVPAAAVIREEQVLFTVIRRKVSVNCKINF